jgi:hypothetical protein
MGVRSTKLGAVLAVALVTIAGGCSTSDADPPPNPKPQYGQISEGFCENLPFEVLLDQFGLNIAADHDQTSDYRNERTHSRQRCSFVAIARDGRFATDLGDFQPAGSVQVRVYHEAAAAAAAYKQDAYNYFDLQEETVPGITTDVITGWWGDSGRTAEATQPLDSNGSTTGNARANRISVTHLVHHENLVLMVYESAIAATSETEEAFAVLNDLADALIDETVTHLDRE